MREQKHSSPTVSVIIPTYNRAHLVGRAIRSVLAQTFQDLEVIVVDDCSTDDTAAVVADFDDPSILYLRHEVNRGVSSARNTGIRDAEGEYIAFLDSDDEWLPPKLEAQLKVFRQTKWPSLGIVLCGAHIVEDSHILRTSCQVPPQGGWGCEDVLRGNLGWLSPGTWMIRRTAFSSIPMFDETFKTYEDRDYLIGASQKCQLTSVSEPLVLLHTDGTDHLWQKNLGNALQGRLRLLDKHHAALARLPQLLSLFEYRAATLYYQLGDMRRFRHHLLKAIRAYPRNPKLYFWLTLACLGYIPFRCVSEFIGRMKRTENRD